jgi:hypothetical protein
MFSHDFSVLWHEEVRGRHRLMKLGVRGGRKNSCGNIENNLLAQAEDACIVAYIQRDVDLMAESPNEDELLFILTIRATKERESDVYNAGSTNLLIGI